MGRGGEYVTAFLNFLFRVEMFQNLAYNFDTATRIQSAFDKVFGWRQNKHNAKQQNNNAMKRHRGFFFRVWFSLRSLPSVTLLSIESSRVTSSAVVRCVSCFALAALLTPSDLAFFAVVVVVVLFFFFFFTFFAATGAAGSEEANSKNAEKSEQNRGY